MWGTGGGSVVVVGVVVMVWWGWRCGWGGGVWVGGGGGIDSKFSVQLVSSWAIFVAWQLSRKWVQECEY